jgi:hypothetical protein
MSFYSDLAADADLLLAEFGQSITIRRQTAGEYDPETGSAAITTSDEVGNGCVFDFGLHASGQSFSAGSMILAGDKQLLLSPVGIAAPAPGCLAIIGADAWNIVSVKSTAPAGVAVIYECQLRK